MDVIEHLITNMPYRRPTTSVQWEEQHASLESKEELVLWIVFNRVGGKVCSKKSAIAAAAQFALVSESFVEDAIDRFLASQRGLHPKWKWSNTHGVLIPHRY